MNCPVRERIEEYLDGALEAEAARGVRTHLDKCESCRALYNELEKIDTLVGAWQVELPGDEYFRSLAARTGAEKAAGGAGSGSARALRCAGRLFWGAMEAAAAAIIVLAAWALLSYEAPVRLAADENKSPVDNIYSTTMTRYELFSANEFEKGVAGMRFSDIEEEI